MAQGSYIGPLLFAILISSLKPLKSCTTLIKYADDVSILTRITPSQDFTQLEYNHVAKWASDHGMSLNFSKTLVVNFSTKRQKNFVTLVHSNNEPIRTMDSCKILGLTIHNNLKWSGHVAYVTAKANKLLIFVLQLRRSGCSISQCWTFHNAIIRSILCYAWPAFMNISRGEFNNI